MNEQLQNYSEKYPKTEKIDGRIYLMSAPCDEHIDVQVNLATVFTNYFKKNKRRCRARTDAKTNIDEGFVKPDLKIVCFEKNNDGIPVIVIEVLSKSTADIDRGIKMKKYAALGIKEYWIIIWQAVSVEIYLLNEEKKYEHYKTYSYYSSEKELEELEELEERDLKEAVNEFSPVSFPELTVKLEDVFDIF